MTTEPTPDWAAWVGREARSTAFLDPAHANRLALTLDREPDLRSGDPLPPAWHWTYFHDDVRQSSIGPDGHPRPGLVLPDVGLPRRMWAGGALRFIEPLRLGTMVERRSTVRSIVPKEGRSGALCFVAVEHELWADGRLHLAEEQSIVYREAAPAAPAASAPPAAPASATPPAPAASAPPDAAPPAAAFSATWTPDSTMLFRYSALTFNAHRIHYDAEYARVEEGYPALVVHGPLIATLLLDLAARHRRSVGRFAYRARAPLHLGDSFTVNGRPEGDRTALWAANGRGGVAMEGELEPA